jgi:uncharacterized repeat protein (TIGR01451 family)
VTADGGLIDRAQHNLVVQEAKLAVHETGPTMRYIGRPATWEIAVTNPGEVPLNNVVLHDQLSPELSFVSATSGGKVDNGQVVWDLGVLQPRETKTVMVTTKCDKMTPRAASLVTATAEPGQEAHDEAALEIRGLPAFRLEVVDLEDPVEVGAKTTYKIDVTNQGSLAGNQVAIVATVPPEMKLLSASGPTAYRIEGDRVIFAPLDALAPRQAVSYSVEVQALKSGDVRFLAELTSATLSAPVKEEESTRIYAPGERRTQGSTPSSDTPTQAGRNRPSRSDPPPMPEPPAPSRFPQTPEPPRSVTPNTSSGTPASAVPAPMPALPPQPPSSGTARPPAGGSGTPGSSAPVPGNNWIPASPPSRVDPPVTPMPAASTPSGGSGPPDVPPPPPLPPAGKQPESGSPGGKPADSSLPAGTGPTLPDVPPPPPPPK